VPLGGTLGTFRAPTGIIKCGAGRQKCPPFLGSPEKEDYRCREASTSAGQRRSTDGKDMRKGNGNAEAKATGTVVKRRPKGGEP